MNKPINLFFCILIFILQLIISDYLHLGSYISICLIPFLIFNIPLQMRPHFLLIAAFMIGLGLDILSDGVAGLNSAAAVAAAATKKFFYRIFINSDRQDATRVPIPQETGIAKYLKFATAVIVIYVAVYIALDCISFRPFLFVLAKFAASTAVSLALTLLLCLSYQNRS